MKKTVWIITRAVVGTVAAVVTHIAALGVVSTWADLTPSTDRRFCSPAPT
ncbi:hypothetical protein [Frankia tisae]|nr:hypothetical protein [Frankia tisae]